MSILSLVAIGATAMAVMSAPDLSPHLNSQGPIGVISNSHEVRYPDEVVFRLEAEAGSTITEVTLFYRLGRQDIRVYGYPAFTPAKRISTDFRLRTGGANYIPPGVDIEYFYQINDEAGNSLETQTYSLEYRDPRYRWQKLRQGELVLLWHDIPLDRVRVLAENVERRLQAVKQLLGLEEAPTVKAVLFVNRRETELGFPVISEAASAGHLFGGFAFPEYGLFVLAGLSEDGVVHEATHLLVDEAVGSPLGRVPAWLNEGLAMYSESSSYGRQAVVERAVRNDALLSLGTMNAVPGRPSDVRLFYAQAWSVVKYIVDTYGTERMTSLLRSMDSGARIDQAVEDVYDITLEELERRWRADLAGETPVAPRPDPGTIAVSGIIAGAIVIAVLASGYRWVAHRAGREGLANPGR